VSERRLKTIEITNFKAIENLVIEAGACTVVAGRNGLGKSSVLDAVESIFDGGHDPRVIRGYDGAGGLTAEADKAVVTLTLDDGTTISKVSTRNGSTLTVRTAEGGIVKGPKKYVERLARSFAFDPLAFCAAKAEERLKWLSEVMPAAFSADEINSALGRPLIDPGVSLDLERLDALRTGIYEERRTANVRAREAEGAVVSLKSSLPVDDGTDWKAKAENIEDGIRVLDDHISVVKVKVSAEAELQKAALRAAAQEKVVEVEVVAEQVIEAASAEVECQVRELRLQLGEARQKAEQATRASALRGQVVEWQLKAREANFNADCLRRDLEALDVLKKSKLDSLPVPGVAIGDILDAKGDVKGKDLAVNGVLWPHVNTSEQMLVAMQIGLQGAGELPLLICDHGGEFDDERLSDLAAKAKAAGIQLLIARAEPKPLTVEVIA
jgi:energy-coupling factor transporter ATP-binding protein EcfA2